jgi:hypothetical protein
MFAFKLPTIEAVRDMRRRFGMGASTQRALERLLKSIMFFEWMNIIVLDRDRLRPLDAALTARFSSRLATVADLQTMSADPRLQIDVDESESFAEDDDSLFAASPHRRPMHRLRAGDSCLLSYVDGDLAGYTWAHTLGRAELVPGLVVSVPAHLIYNYDALTLPEFRGLGLQAYRHHQLLNSGLWEDKRGLLGFVLQTNFASRHGQAKSGYRTIGSVCVLGSRDHFVALFSRSLPQSGIRRLGARRRRAAGYSRPA